MKAEKSWYPDATDRDYVEGLAGEPSDAFLAIEAAAEPDRIPILDREAGRVLTVLAADRRRIVEIGTAIGYSTLWMATGQPPDGTIVTVDPDRGRTDTARGFWRQAGIAESRITVINRPAIEALDAGDPALAGPFDLAFIDALKAEYRGYLERLESRLAPNALIVADNVLWSGKISGSKPADPNDESTAALRAFNEWLASRSDLVTTILPVGDGLLVAARRQR
jgi:predicted O-methyltransferase YrrM